MVKAALMCVGGITSKMAEVMAANKRVICYAAAAREFARAQLIADKYGFEKAYGSYEELVEDEEVELVYISGIHPVHYPLAKMCLEHGKHVICEKPFTLNAVQAKELFDIAEEKHLFITEAMWTRFMPGRCKLDEILRGKELGEVRSVFGQYGFQFHNTPRLTEPELGGGALLDLGIYPINFASIVLGDQVKRVSSFAELTEKGMDRQSVIQLEYENGAMASLMSSMNSCMDACGIINCERGMIKVDNLLNFSQIKIYAKGESEPAVEYCFPEEINDFQYELEAFVEALEHGQTEAELMPHRETMRIMRLMDDLRRDWGVKYPQED